VARSKLGGSKPSGAQSETSGLGVSRGEPSYPRVHRLLLVGFFEHRTVGREMGRTPLRTGSFRRGTPPPGFTTDLPQKDRLVGVLSVPVKGTPEIKKASFVESAPFRTNKTSQRGGF